jgi:hypothetical protein
MSVSTQMVMSSGEAAVCRALSAVQRPRVWQAAAAPADIVAMAGERAGSGRRPLGVVDLSLPGVTRALLLLYENALELVASTGTSVGYDALVREPVTLLHSGYGFTAVVSAGGARMDLRGREQTTLLLEVLHILREELMWTA